MDLKQYYTGNGSRALAGMNRPGKNGGAAESVSRSSANQAAPIPSFVHEIQARLESYDRYAPVAFVISLILFIHDAWKTSSGRNGAQMFCVESEPGTGKSMTTRSVLEAAGIRIVELDTAMLESHMAGEPARYTLRKLHEASKSIDEHGCTVVLIEDFDLIFKQNSMERTGTVNTDQVQSVLQRYCDDPTQILGQKCNPVPIITTANDTSRMREPFIRSGRAERYIFQPSHDDLIRMAAACLKGRIASPQFKLLIQRASDWRIAHFRELAGRIERVARLQRCADLTLKALFKRKPDRSASSKIHTVCDATLAACIDAVEAGMVRRNYLDD